MLLFTLPPQVRLDALLPVLCSCVAQHLNVPEGYASAFRSLRPRWMAFLNILHLSLPFRPPVRTPP